MTVTEDFGARCSAAVAADREPTALKEVLERAVRDRELWCGPDHTAQAFDLFQVIGS